MNYLELKVPPLVVVLVTALAMWLVSWFLPFGAVVMPARILFAVTLAILGAATSALGVVAFLRARTTVNPTRPEATSSLVSSGVYLLTRNPMYLGFLLILSGWAIFLANLVVFPLLPVFVFYITRFQIQPEEKALTIRFGQGFVRYTNGVRRWI